MPKGQEKKRCFIIMPISTPEDRIHIYGGDKEHFTHVFEYLFSPALEKAGFESISPKSDGSEIIHAEIIGRLSECELVLCDMSVLNPNVFFEFGIRTALNKPVALVVDDETPNIPFDTGIINFHTYQSSLDVWIIEKEIDTLAKHVQSVYKKAKRHNALWKFFGVAQTGIFKPEDSSVGDKLDLILQEIASVKRQAPGPAGLAVTDTSRTREVLEGMIKVLKEGRPEGTLKIPEEARRGLGGSPLSYVKGQEDAVTGMSIAKNKKK